MTQKLMSINIKSLCFVGLAILLAVSTQQLAQAQQSKDYQDGHQAGLAAGAADENEGYPKLATCQGEHTADIALGSYWGIKKAMKLRKKWIRGLSSRSWSYFQ